MLDAGDEHLEEKACSKGEPCCSSEAATPEHIACVDQHSQMAWLNAA
jgi:hypothetical protein